MTLKNTGKYAESLKEKHIYSANMLLSLPTGEKDVKINVGKGLYDFPSYNIGNEIAVGYCGRKPISIRLGIVQNED